MNQSQMLEKLDASMLQSQDIFGKEANRMTRQTGYSEYSKSQSICFDQIFMGSSQILNISDQLLDRYYFKQKKKIILIQSYFKGHLERKKYIQIKKWALYRRHVYLELQTTEQDYLRDLKTVINNVKIAAEQFKLLPENEIQITFSNICYIYDFNLKFYEEIKQEFKSYHPNSCFGSIFQKFIPFFKIYFQYFSEYKDYQINYLRQTYPAFDEHMTRLDQGNIFRGTDLNSFLVKPVQRLPKYALLIKDLVKHTWNSHPDYQNLLQTLQQFNLVTAKIDQLMGHILKNQALFDLQKKFFDALNINIVESTRNFILTETVSLMQGQEELVNLYFCNDMVVLSKTKTEFSEKDINERLLTFSYINENSLIEDDESFPMFLRLIAQDQTIIFICQDLEQKQKIVKEFQSIIKSQSQTIYSNKCVSNEQQSDLIRVFVTQISRGQSRLPFKTFAKYDVLINFDKKEYKIWTRHKILLKIQNNLKKQFKKEYETQKDNNILFQSWVLSNLKKKQNEGRQIIVETFLETLLNSQYMKQAPDNYLKYLGLPQKFYQNTKCLSKQTSILEVSDQSKSSQDS